MNQTKLIRFIILSFCLVVSISVCLSKESTKPALMWFDATANYARFSDVDSIDFYLEKIKSLGFTDAVVDVRPISGYVLYQSQYAPFLKEYQGTRRDENFDFLGYFIEKSHQLGLKVHASLNTFVAGHNFVDKGIIYEQDKQTWATIVYTPDKGLVPITEEKHKYSAMVNPINSEFQNYILNIFKEVARKYPKLDGIILDRVRYDGITADFSDFTKQAFEKHIGTTIENFPDDIFTWETNANGSYYPKPSKHYMQWLEWRAGNIRDFMTLARKEIKSINSKLSFGTYTGAWYPTYFEVGVNFASKNYDPSKDFDWANPTYKNTGYAEFIDLFTVGNYYTAITKEEYRRNNPEVKNETDLQAQKSIWYCVEGSNENLKSVMKGNKFYGGILADQFYDNPNGLAESIKMNLATSDGLMIFDIVHIINKNMWDYVEKGMREGGAIK